VSNLFLAGRIISATHVAFGSTRVMGTGAHGGQAVAMAAALCKKYGISPRQVGQQHIKELQLELLRAGQHLPGMKLEDKDDLVQQAVAIEASSTLVLSAIPSGGTWKPILHAAAQMLPVSAGKMPVLSLQVNALEDTLLYIELRKSSKVFNHTPDITLDNRTISLKKGRQEISLDFDVSFTECCYAFICFQKNPQAELEYSDKRISGVLSVFNSVNEAVSNYGKQSPTDDIGVESFEFWCPQRRPGGQNIAMRIHPGLQAFSPENLRNGWQRPVSSTNAWAADYNDRAPKITFRWNKAVTINRLELSFDVDYDHPMENVLIHQHDAVQPFCATEVTVLNCDDQPIAAITANHQARQIIHLDKPAVVSALKLLVKNNNPDAPVSLFEVRCYE
jgi:hypothetical protein